jgi:hypothetical protein
MCGAGPTRPGLWSRARPAPFSPWVPIGVNAKILKGDEVISYLSLAVSLCN